MTISRHTYDMGIIGNCSYMAYASKMGSINWMCWPSFDSDPIFYSLLDSDNGGTFTIEPLRSFESKQRYIHNTNILITEFFAEDGIFHVIDFAPRFDLYNRIHRPISLFRKIVRVEGNPMIKIICVPKVFSTGETIPAIIGSNHISFKTSDLDLRLTTDISKHRIIDQEPFALTQDCNLVFSYGDNHLEAPLKETLDDFLQKSTTYWQTWIRRTNLPPIFQKEIIRSALILKLHQDEDSGAIIASGSMGLPEHPGSGRTWDYRYCWIRDSYFTLSALYSLGHFSEIEKFSHYIQNIALQAKDTIRPVYKINAKGPVPEITIDHLKGYMNEKPIRKGNAAYDQIQNDSYGQILLLLLPLYLDKRVHDTHSRPSKSLIEKLLHQIEKSLDQPDAGMWEYRQKQFIHCSTALFQWAGLQAAYKIANELNDNKLASWALQLQSKAEKIIEECFDPNLKCYLLGKGSQVFDASLFLLSSMNYLSPRSEKSFEHITRLTKELSTGKSLFYRYQHLDDFGETHSAFLVCSFWHIEALINLGHLDQAYKAIEEVLTYSNHLQIFSEDVSPTDGSQWGNFGQTYSHVGLINAVFKIAQEDKRQYFQI